MILGMLWGMGVGQAGGVSPGERGERSLLCQDTEEGDCDLLKRTDPSVNDLEREPWEIFWLLGSRRSPRTLDGVDPYYIRSLFLTHTLACFCKTPTASHLENTGEKRVWFPLNTGDLGTWLLLQVPGVVGRVDETNTSGELVYPEIDFRPSCTGLRMISL
jgi:hypothetical protein